MNFEIGQTLFVVFNGRRSNRTVDEMPITKVGRKWLTLGADWQAVRANRDTLILDGGGYSSPGSCYLSREAYEQELALSTEWNKFRSEIDKERRVPHGVTVETIRIVRTMLLYGEAPAA